MPRPLKQTPLAIKRRRERERAAKVAAGTRRRHAAIKGLIRKHIKEAQEEGWIVQALFKASNHKATENLPQGLKKTEGAGRLQWVSANLMDDYIDELADVLEHPRPGLTVQSFTVKIPGERHATTYRIAGGRLFKKQVWQYERAALKKTRGKRAQSSAAKKKR